MKQKGKFLRKAVAWSLMGSAVVLWGGPWAEAAETEDKPKEYTLSDIVVYGERSEDVYAGGYIARESGLQALGSTDFMDIPFNATTFTEKAISRVKQPGNTLVQLVTLDPTVTSRGNKTYNDIKIRGFSISPHDYFLNGVSGMLSQSSIPMNFVERVEVVSGPDTLLHGVTSSGSVGGSINLVPKVAEDTPRITFTETFSGKSHYEHALDLGARFEK